MLSFAACTSSEPPSPQSQTHWLAKCDVDDECGDLSCICGSCVARCAAGVRCSVEGLQTECQPSTSEAASALCDGHAPTSVCLVPCDGSCTLGQRCVGAACVPDARASMSGGDAATADSGMSGAVSAGRGGTGGAIRPGALDASAADGGAAPADSGAALADGGAALADGSIAGVDCRASPPEFPSFDRSCSTPSDCAIGTLSSYCGASVTGIRASEADAYAAAAQLCFSQLLPSTCPRGPSFADDGSMSNAPGNTQALVDCVAGQCQTSFGVPTGVTSCGGQGTQCDARTEVCVERVNVGVSGTYGCEPVPAGCETTRSCGCVAATFCTGAYNECWEAGYNGVACACATCQ